MGWVTRRRIGEGEGEMERWGQEREWWNDVRNHAHCVVTEGVGWVREGEVLSLSRGWPGR